MLFESFLIDRTSQGLFAETIELYTKKLQYFLRYCERQSLTQISQLTSDFIRRYLLEISEPYTDEDHIRIKTIGNVQILEIELDVEGGYIERLKRKGWI